MEQRHGPLAGIRILDLTGQTGQPAGRYLADLGADVVLVEPPGGTMSRGLAPMAPAKNGRGEGKSTFFLHFNTNKRSAVLDLDEPEGRETFLQLVRGADAVIESFNPGYLAGLSLGFEQLERERPGLVMTSVTPFGQTGLYSGFRGNDLVADAMGGFVYTEGERDGRPVVQPRYQALQMAGLHAAFGTLLALRHSRNTGQGQQVDVSVQEVVASEYFNLVNYGSWQDITMRVGKLSSGRPTDYFPCKDGWVLVSIVLPHQWSVMAEWSQDELLVDSMFNDHAARAENVELVYERIAAFTLTFTVQEFLEGSIARRIPAGPVNDVKQFIEHPQTAARSFLIEVDDPIVGPYKAAGAPARYSVTPWAIDRPAPEVGQHTTEVLSEPNLAASRTLRTTGTNGLSVSEEAPLPLTGVRVLDLTKSWAGPFGCRYLADFGAEVIRIESAKFPEGRQLNREPDPANWLRSNTMYAEINRNKLSVTLDLHTEEGKDLLRKLVAESDVVVENFHYATLPRWGLGYEDLRAINPGLIMLSAPGFGTTGPAADYFAYGGCIAAFTGLGYLWGHEGADQTEKTKQAYTDFVTAANLALGVTAALRYRDETGEGQHIELTQADAAASMVGTAILEYTLNGENPEPWGNRDPNVAPQGVYQCRGEDRWVAISCADDAEWTALCDLMGAQDLRSDPRFSNLEGRKVALDELDARIGEWAARMTPNQVMHECQRAGVTAGVVASGEDLFLDPHLRARGYVIEIDHPSPGRLEHPGFTVGLSRTPGRIRMPAPMTGEHTQQVLAGLLGATQDQLASLQESGALA